MEKRRHPRTAVSNLAVNVSDGYRFFSGIVTDISCFGFCMEELSKSITSNGANMSVVVSGYHNFFKLKVKERWSMVENHTKTMGVQIMNASREWIDFTMRVESKQFQFVDAWGNVHLR